MPSELYIVQNTIECPFESAQEVKALLENGGISSTYSKDALEGGGQLVTITFDPEANVNTVREALRGLELPEWYQRLPDKAEWISRG